MKERLRVSVLALAFSTTLLAACGGGGGDPATAASAPAGANSPPSGNPPATNNPRPSDDSNSAPQIVGTPITSAIQGAAYVFAPSATDADGNTLTFSIANLPPWATFDSSTGRLTGTPTGTDIGAYNDIAISVSDGSASSNLTAFDIQVVGAATDSMMLSWTPPTENTDGSPLNDLAGYKVYWGTSRGNYSNSVTIANPGLATYVVSQLTPAQWYFVVTAYSSTGFESEFSNSVSKTIQ